MIGIHNYADKNVPEINLLSNLAVACDEILGEKSKLLAVCQTVQTAPAERIRISPS